MIVLLAARQSLANCLITNTFNHTVSCDLLLWFINHGKNRRWWACCHLRWCDWCVLKHILDTHRLRSTTAFKHSSFVCEATVGTGRRRSSYSLSIVIFFSMNFEHLWWVACWLLEYRLLPFFYSLSLLLQLLLQVKHSALSSKLILVETKIFNEIGFSKQEIASVSALTLFELRSIKVRTLIFWNFSSVGCGHCSPTWWASLFVEQLEFIQSSRCVGISHVIICVSNWFNNNWICTWFFYLFSLEVESWLMLILCLFKRILFFLFFLVEDHTVLSCFSSSLGPLFVPHYLLPFSSSISFFDVVIDIFVLGEFQHF